MADESDVEIALKNLIVGYLYPSGVTSDTQPSAMGVPVKVVRGWPQVNTLEYAKTQSLKNKSGLLIVSVATRVGFERNTTRRPLAWVTTVPPVHTLTATVNGGNGIIIGGTVAVPQNVIAIIGGSMQPQAFSYAVQATDTPGSIATGLARLIAHTFPGTSANGAIITVNSNLPVVARVASAGTVALNVGMAEKEFQITVWAPPCNAAGQDADAWRIAASKLIDPPLRALDRIVLPDQFYARVRYERTVTMDVGQAQGFYRRDLFFVVEFAATISQQATEIGAAQTQLQGAVSPTGTLPVPTDAPTVTTNS